MTEHKDLLDDDLDSSGKDILRMQISVLKGVGGTLEAELYRTAEMLVQTAEDQGVYFAIALLYDSAYDHNRIKKLLPILQKTSGAIKPKADD